MNGFPVIINSRQDVLNLLADPAYHGQALAFVQALLDERYGWASQGDLPLNTQVETVAGHRVRTDYDATGTPTARHLDQWMLGQGEGLSRIGVTVADALGWGCQDRAVPPPADDMEAIKATARAMLDRWTDARMFGTFTDSQGHIYKVNKPVRDWMTGLEAKLAGGMALPSGFTWDDANGNPITHTSESFRTLTAEIALWTDALYRACTRAQAAVDAAGDAVAVDKALSGVVWP